MEQEKGQDAHMGIVIFADMIIEQKVTKKLNLKIL